MALAFPGCKSPALYEEINTLILEYLELNGLDKSISAFSSECRARSLPGPFNSGDDTRTAFSFYEGEKLLKAFDEGDLEVFVKLWKSFQGHVQVTSDDMKKLEVYLRVHFALWPCAHGEPEGVQSQAMNHLKVFFEQQSCQLSHDAAILPLFALPYVSDPKNHPIFRDLFQPTWSQRLRSQLEATLVKYFDLLQQNLGTHSKLAAIVLKSRSQDLNYRDRYEEGSSNLSTAYHRERFFQLVKTYRQARKLLKNTRESYGKLLKISNELIIGLEASVGGQQLSLEPIMKRCYEIFPELFTPVENHGVVGQPDREYFKRLAQNAHFDNIIDSDVSLFFIGITDVTPENLDFDKVKSVLKGDGSNNLDKLCLLQALRWLLTKSTPKCRQTTMSSFIEADILGLRTSSDTFRNRLFESMLSPTPTYSKECFARLLNTFASMKAGRAYMSESSHCVNLLVKSLHTFRGLNESYICQMVIATLQKLSLRKQMRLEMIERNVISWLVTYLKKELARGEGAALDAKYYNPYLMEYAWALLMNLCLHDEARPACTAIATEVVSCVTQMLLRRPSREVYPYVISTLYSLLRNPEIFATAKKLGIQKMFASCEDIEDTEMAHHFNHVTALLQADGFDRVNTTTGEVDYDDDDDLDPSDFEPELEVSEAWEESLTEANPTGDDLLMRSYLKSTAEPSHPSLPSPPISHKPPLTKQGSEKNLTVFNRPTTPAAAAAAAPPSVIQRETARSNSTRSSNSHQPPARPITDDNHNFQDDVRDKLLPKTRIHSSSPSPLPPQSERRRGPPPPEEVPFPQGHGSGYEEHLKLIPNALASAKRKVKDNEPPSTSRMERIPQKNSRNNSSNDMVQMRGRQMPSSEPAELPKFLTRSSNSSGRGSEGYSYSSDNNNGPGSASKTLGENLLPNQRKKYSRLLERKAVTTAGGWDERRIADSNNNYPPSTVTLFAGTGTTLPG